MPRRPASTSTLVGRCDITCMCIMITMCSIVCVAQPSSAVQVPISIRGIVYDDYFLEELPYATVRVVGSQYCGSGTSISGVYQIEGVMPGRTVFDVTAPGFLRHRDTILLGATASDTVINFSITSTLPVNAIIKKELTSQEASDLLTYRDSLRRVNERMQVLRVTIDSMWWTPGLGQLMADIKFTNLCELPIYLLSNFPPCLESIEAIYSRASGDKVHGGTIIDCIGEKTAYREEDIFVVSPRAITHWKTNLGRPDLVEGETYHVRLRYHHSSKAYVFVDKYTPKASIRVEVQALEGSFLSDNEYDLPNPITR